MALWTPRANEIFATAAEMPGEQREAYLVEVCGADSELRGQVDDLLSAHDRAGDFLDQPAAGLVVPDSGPPLPGGADVVRALRLREVEGETITVAPLPAQAEADIDLPERYRMEGEIARGGMGAILKGHDEELGRDIAVKVLLETHQGRTELVQRFVEEAQIAGQLQHPGIVPVYEMGGKEGKRPYFTMKLVKGQTLAKLLKERSSAAEDLSRFVGIFEQVCQTLAYAHARGVIHRDLKPANIMVGAFGEVQVMDWGLAKLLANAPRRSEEAEEPGTIIQTERSGGEGEAGRTSAGSVLGTPSYMAPEQARGEVERIDERADVFGLGACLCEILTGKPPFAGKTAEAMRLARKGDLDDALTRLDGCGADGELVALAKRCLADEPEGRPANAGAVAQAVIGYQRSVEARLRRAEVERERAQVRAVEEAKRRKLTLALAASVLVTMVLGGGGYTWLQQQHREQRAVRGRAIDAALDSVAVLRGRAAVAPPGDLSAWNEAQSELRRIDLLVQGDVEEAVRDRVATVRDELQRGRDEAERRAQDALAERNLQARLESIWGNRSEHMDYRRADQNYADAFRAFGVDVDQDEPREAGAKLSGRPGTVEIAAALDEWCRLRREVLAGQQGVRPWRRLVEVARLADPDPWRNRLRETLKRPVKEAAEILKKQGQDVAALEQQPAATLLLLARLLAQTGGRKERAEVLRIAWRRFPGNYWVNHEMVLIHEGAEQVRFATAAVVASPGSARAHNNLGVALGRQGKVAEGIDCYRKAIALDPKHALAHNNLGAELAGLGKLDEAIACFEKAIDLEPNDSGCHSNLGKALADKGKLDEAIACYRKAIELDGRNAGAHNHLGNALSDQGKLDEAIASYQKAIEIDPKDAKVHTNLGLALAAKGKVDEAIACHKRSIELNHKYATAYNHLGVALRAKGLLDEAIVSFRKAIDLDSKHFMAHNNLASSLRKQGKVDEAIACYKKAIELAPKNPTIHSNLGGAWQTKGQEDEAIACYQKAIEIDRKFVKAYLGLGVAYYLKADFVEAEANLRRCLDLLSAKDELRPIASGLLEFCQRMQPLEKKLPGVLAGRINPTNAERIEFLELCTTTKRHHAAARLSAQIIASDPKRADDPRSGLRYNAACFAALAAAGQGKDADKLDAMQRLALRRQSLTWLRADLAQWKRLVESGEVGRGRMTKALAHWQKDSDLVSLRDAEALKKLSPEERQACERLWADVGALLKTGESKAK